MLGAPQPRRPKRFDFFGEGQILSGSAFPFVPAIDLPKLFGDILIVHDLIPFDCAALLLGHPHKIGPRALKPIVPGSRLGAALIIGIEPMIGPVSGTALCVGIRRVRLFIENEVITKIKLISFFERKAHPAIVAVLDIAADKKLAVDVVLLGSDFDDDARLAGPAAYEAGLANFDAVDLFAGECHDHDPLKEGRYCAAFYSPVV